MADKLVSARTTVDAPPHVVFDILTDPRQHSRIDGSGSVGNIIEGPGRLRRKGDVFRVRMRLFGLPYDITNRVVEIELDRRIAWRHYGGHRWRYELEPTGEGGTAVTETFDFSHHPPLASALIRITGFPGRNRRGIEKTLVRLKDAAEADAGRQGNA